MTTHRPAPGGPFPPFDAGTLAAFVGRALADPEPSRSRVAAELWPHVVRICGAAKARELFNAVPPANGVIAVPSLVPGVTMPVPVRWTLTVDSNRDSLLPIGSELPIPITMTWAGRIVGGGWLWGGVTPGDAGSPRTVSFRIDPQAGVCRLKFRYGSFLGRAGGLFTGKLALTAQLADFLPAALVPAVGGRLAFTGDFGA